MPQMGNPADGLRAATLTYFGLEKVWTTGLAVAGICALILAISLWLSKGAYRGSAIPLALLGLFEIGIGAGVALRTDRQVHDLVAQVDSGEDMTVERDRMVKVMRTFEVVKIAEIVLITVGVVMTYAFRDRPMAFSAGVALIAQCGALLVFDLVAEQRAGVYASALDEHTSGS